MACACSFSIANLNFEIENILLLIKIWSLINISTSHTGLFVILAKFPVDMNNSLIVGKSMFKNRRLFCVSDILYRLKELQHNKYTRSYGVVGQHCGL